MDRIITIIIILYIFKKLYEAISGDQRGGKGTPTYPNLPRSQRPSSSTTVKSQTGHPHPGAPKGWQDMRRILTDQKRISEAQKGADTLKGIPRNPIKAEKQEIRFQGKRAPSQENMAKEEAAERQMPSTESKIVPQEKLERDIISFDQPGLFLQGIILSEILGPPVSMKNHIMSPYMRG